MFWRNEFASDSAEVYKCSRYGGDLSKGGKWILSLTQHIVNVGDAWLLL